MTNRYAAKTEVPIDRSQQELKALITRYGATAFIFGEDLESHYAFVEFMMQGRRIRLILKMPELEAFRLTDGRRQRRSDAAMESAWGQACRQRWRALVLIIKAKLEAIESGIASFEEEFLANMVLPSGQRAEDWLVPQIDEAYATGRMPPMLATGRQD